ncbi:MAG: outer membrane protein assembly factor BamA [Alphaproteobacteria bacterium]
MLLLRKILFSTALLFAVGLSSVSLAQSAADRFRVEAILVEGNERVTDATILAYLPIKTGDEIDLQALDQAIGSLFATNLFENVSISRSGNQVIIEIVENPIISRINIEGNDVLTDERLLAELDVQPRRVYTAEVARTATQRLLEIYRLSIIRQDKNRVDLVFEVDEGPLIKIQSIRFLGNSAFSDYALRQIISSRVERWWALFSSTDKYDPGRLDYDVRLLRQFYLSRGYADIDVVRAQGGLLSDRSGFAVTFSLKEGPRYRLKDISFTSEIESVDVSQLRDLIQLEEGDWYDVRAIEEGLLNITNELGNFGYAFVNVTPEVFTDPETQTLNVQINIGAATKNFVERIEVINNSRTLDNVVRRELELVEGDAYNQLKIDRSLRKVRGLGFFRKVDVQTLPGSTEDQSVVQFDVEEQPTGDFSVGLGYSSIDKTTLTLGIKERNFLGSGRATNFAISTSDTRADYRVGLTEPYLFDRNLRGSNELYKEQVKETTVEVETQGLQTSASFNAARDYYHRFG